MNHASKSKASKRRETAKLKKGNEGMPKGRQGKESFYQTLPSFQRLREKKFGGGVPFLSQVKKGWGVYW